jgi:hypothetical protein
MKSEKGSSRLITQDDFTKEVEKINEALKELRKIEKKTTASKDKMKEYLEVAQSPGPNGHIMNIKKFFGES